MSAYIVRRFIVLVPLLLGMTVMMFSVLQLAPGDPLAQLRANPLVSPDVIEEQMARYHFDRPLPVQYGYWLWNLLQGDMGYSLSQKQAVSTVILDRAAKTIVLNVVVIALVWLLALPLGIYCAVHRYTVADRLAAGFAFIGMSFPGFFLALLMLFVLGARLELVPIGGFTSDGFAEMPALSKFLDIAHHLTVPVLVLTLGSLAALQRLMRGNMLEVLREQYVTTARSKGLSETSVVYVHAVRNAINPMITLFGFQLSGLLSGAALVEIICGYPGLGMVMLEAVRSQDIFLVMGSALTGGVLLIVGNLFADVLLAVVDPRISYQ